MTDENIPRRMYYTVEDWVKMGEWPKREKHLDETDLPTVDFMTVQIKPEDDALNPTYITVWGPMEDWDFVEGILAYDYGEEGSRIYPGAASAAA
jgi:hypothetical protein